MKKIFFVYLYIIATALPLFAQSDSQPTVDSLQESRTAEIISVDSLSTDELWSKANNSYLQGNYSKAVEYYTEIEGRDLESVELYYNIGNGYFKLGDVANSMLYLYRAQKLDPADSDTNYNIEIVQSHTKDKIEEVPQFILAEWNETIGSSLSVAWWSIISLVAWGVLLASVIIFILSQQLSKRKMGFYGAMMSLIVMVASTSYAIGERREIVNNHEAVVMVQSLSVKSSPTIAATDLFVLHAGTKVNIISALEGWSNIVIADGRQGWVESKLLETI